MSKWTIDDARTTYRLKNWGEGYFDVNDAGHLAVYPHRDANGIDLYKVTSEIQESGLGLPIMLRFTDILHDRIDRLVHAFGKAMQSSKYNATFKAVYPIKVNQQHHVVEEIMEEGKESVGLEAGSKPELMAVLAMAPQNGGVIVCNGYKDREYIRLALIGQQLGHKVFIVIEKLSELTLAIEEAEKLKVIPTLGIRIRMSSIGAGKWQNTGGEKSKFGLSSAQVLQAIDELKAANLQQAMVMLHFHLGSQIANLQDIEKGVKEAAYFYAELRTMGLPIEYIDAGGGLGVDYEGTGSKSFCSINYSLHEYAESIVQSLKKVCDEKSLPYPNLMTESGRAITAHHAVLITDVVDVEQLPDKTTITPVKENDPDVVQQLYKAVDDINQNSALDIYKNSIQWIADIYALYSNGDLSMEQRARAEHYYHAICRVARPELVTSEHHDVINELNEKLADKYFCNFSLFQSVPDVWAIDQVFPIVPIHRLDEQPIQRGVINDITCDSDGRFDYYVDREGVESTVALHSFNKSEPYLIGIFMIGAYQEILGDMHNLFGDTHSINIEVTSDGNYKMVEPLPGDTVDEVLRYVHLDPDNMLTTYQQTVSATNFDSKQKEAYLKELEAGLRGYTYMEE